MKKALLGTTALVGASLLMAGPVAAEKVPLVPGAAVQPLFPMTLGIGGWANFQSTFTDQQFSQGKGRGVHFDVEDPVVNISFRGRADNGLEYFADFKIHARNIAEVDPYIGFAGSWGTLELGNTKGPAQTLSVGGENIVAGSGNWGYETGENLSDFTEIWNMPKSLLGRTYQNLVFAPATGPLGLSQNDGTAGVAGTAGGGFQGAEAVGFQAVEPRLVGDTGVSTKIVYYTPRLAGVQVGLSYAPDETGRDVNFVEGTTARGLDREFVSRDDNGANQDTFEAAINYQKSYRGVDFSAAWVGIHAKAETASFNTQFGGPLGQLLPDNGTDLRDINSWAAGGSVSYRGFTFAGEYGDNGTSGMAEDLSNVYTAANTLGASIPALGATIPGEVSGDAGQWWNAAAAYDFGATQVSISYFHGDQNIDTCGITAGVHDQAYDFITYNTATCTVTGILGKNARPDPSLVGKAREATLDVFTVGATHRLAEGLVVYANVDYIDFNYPGPIGGITTNNVPAGLPGAANAAGASDFDNQGISVIIGTGVNF
jgi:hypothetical protein